MPTERSTTYICSHCGIRVSAPHGEEPQPWLSGKDGQQIRQNSREPVPWLLKLGEDEEEDLCPVCAEHFRKEFFPAIDDAGSFLGPETRHKIRVADLLRALAAEWDDRIESWPVEGADFNINAVREAAAEAAAAAEEVADIDGEDE